MSLQHIGAKICLTASGALIHQDRILLIQHAKLGFWLMPGGHVEPNELPHQTAEREFLEETGVQVRAFSVGIQLEAELSEYVPVPISSNLHWVCQEHYQARMAGIEYTHPQWRAGCEQHADMKFLVEPVAGVELVENTQETLGIGWFARDEVVDIEAPDSIKQEIFAVFDIGKTA